MTNTVSYKGYIGTVQYSDEDSVFFGQIFGIRDLVSFEGTSVTGLKRAFRSAVEDYISTCRRLGKEPEKSFKGSFNVRVPQHLHKEAAIRATSSGITLNEFVKQAILFAVNHPDKLDIQASPAVHLA